MFSAVAPVTLTRKFGKMRNANAFVLAWTLGYGAWCSIVQFELVSAPAVVD